MLAGWVIVPVQEDAAVAWILWGSGEKRKQRQSIDGDVTAVGLGGGQHNDKTYCTKT
jgi:hypothetical protein